MTLLLWSEPSGRICRWIRRVRRMVLVRGGRGAADKGLLLMLEVLGVRRRRTVAEGGCREGLLVQVKVHRGGSLKSQPGSVDRKT